MGSAKWVIRVGRERSDVREGGEAGQMFVTLH